MNLSYSAKESKQFHSCVTQVYTKKRARRNAVMSEIQVCTQRHAPKMNFVRNIETTLTIAHWLGPNRNLNGFQRIENAQNLTQIIECLAGII